MIGYALGDVIYDNPLRSEGSLSGWVSEGTPVMSWPQGVLRLENGMDAGAGQAANYLLWCPEIFPSEIAVTWKFKPLREPGLAMFWLSATGTEGRDLFDPSLAKRAGIYRQYFDGDVSAYHVSYFRRKQEDERRFHTCNMRKSKGFHLVCQGGDPIPGVDDVAEPYAMQVVKCGGWIELRINDLVIFQWHDDGSVGGPAFGGGRIGFRQMAPLIAEYSDLCVRHVERA